MYTIKNIENDTNYLYLADKVLRFKPKEEKRITKKEYESKEFQKRKDDFLVKKEENKKQPTKMMEEPKKEEDNLAEEIKVLDENFNEEGNVNA